MGEGQGEKGGGKEREGTQLFNFQSLHSFANHLNAPGSYSSSHR